MKHDAGKPSSRKSDFIYFYDLLSTILKYHIDLAKSFYHGIHGLKHEKECFA